VRVSVTEAKAQLTELLRLAEEGEEVIVTRHGRPVASLTPIKRKFEPGERLKIIREIQKEAAGRALAGPSAARSQDFLYDDEFGLPK
jgi:prevent-host-death family protein